MANSGRKKNAWFRVWNRRWKNSKMEIAQELGITNSANSGRPHWSNTSMKSLQSWV